MTTLAVAIFLIGFTMVVGRRLRPPFAAPGLALAVFCFGWAVHIYLKPIPDVAPAALDQAAVGQAALDDGRADDAVVAYGAAVEADPDYPTARAGLGLATLVAANPDLLNTFALTDTDPDVLATADDELTAALDAGADDSPTTVASAALVAFAATDWSRAGELLEDAIELNERTPGAAARPLRSRGRCRRPRRSPSSGWTGVRARCSTWRGPTRPGVSRRSTCRRWSGWRCRSRTGPSSLRSSATRPWRGSSRPAPSRARTDAPAADPEGASISIVTASYANGATEIQLSTSGVEEGAQVAVVGYERPAPGAAWVQPAELFYVGPDVRGDGVSVDGDRSCVAVEYRFDLYVGGEYASSATAPGAAPSC